MSLDIWLQCDVDTGGKPKTITVFEDNITYNVMPMFRLCGVYSLLREIETHTAAEVTEQLKAACKQMRDRIDECRALNPKNGWGDADGALKWLGRLTAACLRYPKARIEVWR